MTKLADEIDRHEAVFGKALCWLRLARGIPSLLMADRLFQERVRGDAPHMGFGGDLSRYERGVNQPGTRRMLEILAVYAIEWRDFGTAIDVMLRATRSMAALKRSLAEGTALRHRIEDIVICGEADRRDARDVALEIAQAALDR